MKNYRKLYKDIYRDKYKKKYGIDISGFVVHHIDHNRENNSICNLVALPADLHVRYHKLHEEARRFQFKVPTSVVGNCVSVGALQFNSVADYMEVLQCCMKYVDMKHEIDVEIMRGEK